MAKTNIGRETSLSHKNITKKVINYCFSSPFESTSNVDRVKEVTSRAYNILYETTESPIAYIYSNADVKNYMTFKNAPSTKLLDIIDERDDNTSTVGIPIKVFQTIGAPASPYFPNLSSPGHVQGKVNIVPHDNVFTPTTATEEVKSSFYITSPNDTSTAIGKSSLQNDLTKGYSLYSKPTPNSPNSYTEVTDLTTPVTVFK